MSLHDIPKERSLAPPIPLLVWATEDFYCTRCDGYPLSYEHLDCAAAQLLTDVEDVAYCECDIVACAWQRVNGGLDRVYHYFIVDELTSGLVCSACMASTHPVVRWD